MTNKCPIRQFVAEFDDKHECSTHIRITDERRPHRNDQGSQSNPIGPSPCPGDNPNIQLQARIETAAASSDPLTAKALRQASRWQSVAAPAGGCADSTDWQPAQLAIPATLQGQPATIHLRVRQFGRNWSPIVYLRHFTMQ